MSSLQTQRKGSKIFAKFTENGILAYLIQLEQKLSKTSLDIYNFSIRRLYFGNWLFFIQMMALRSIQTGFFLYHIQTSSVE